MFQNIEKTLFQIKRTLLNSSDLKKLIVYNTPDALTKAEPSYADAESAIYIKPIIYIYEDSPESGVSSFISIGLIQAEIDNNSFSSAIKISVACDREVLILNNDRLRNLALVDCIIEQINNHKFQAAGTLQARIVQEIYYDDSDYIGFAILFDIDDSYGDVVDEH